MRYVRQLTIIAVASMLLVMWNLQSSVLREEPLIASQGEVLATETIPPAVEPSPTTLNTLPGITFPSTQAVPLLTSPPVIHGITSNWKPPAMVYANSNFGTTIAAPILNQNDEWCRIELLGQTRVNPVYHYDPLCVEEPLRQGNFSSIEDFMAFENMPSVSPVSFLNVTDDERKMYWDDNDDPYIAHCRSCANSLVHKTLYRARRWWRMRAWRRRESATGPLLRMYGSFIGVHRHHFTTRRGTISTSGFDFEPFNLTMDLSVEFDQIERIQLCLSADAFIQLALRGGGEIVMQPQIPKNGVACFWRSMQLLFSSTLAAKTFLMDSDCTFSAANGASHSLGTFQAPVPQDHSFHFTPCYRNDITNLSRVIAANGMMGQRKNFWPFTCDAMRNTENCGQRERINRQSNGVSQEIRVAVALAGLVRSFASARSFIYDNVIRPHRAMLFGATWNVVGRGKKSVEINRKMVVRPGVMYNTLAPLFGIQQNETFPRLEVLDYFRHIRSHKVLQANGLLHPGLYFMLVRSLLLVYNSNVSFDIVIRSRFDLFAATPLFFTRMKREAPGSGVEYALDTGSSCLMDGVWWPQFAKFGDGRVLKHYADTRMKYFSWQVCDWIDIGTYDTMRTFTTMFDWMVEHNVHTAAQFVDHAFFLDHNLTYLPMQLYLKIARHRHVLFG